MVGGQPKRDDPGRLGRGSDFIFWAVGTSDEAKACHDEGEP
jgi:hypothetical protein